MYDGIYVIQGNGHPWVYAKERGKYPAISAYKLGKERGDQVFVSRGTSSGRRYAFSSFKDGEALWEYVLKTPAHDRYFRTIDTSTKDESTSSLYLDIEWIVTEAEPDARQRVDHIISSVTHSLSQLKTSTAVLNPVTVDFSRARWEKFKHSFHVHFPSIIFTDTLAMGAFVKQYVVPHACQSPLFYSIGGKPVLDTSIYTRNRTMRLPGCRKDGTDPPKQCPDKQTFLAALTSGNNHPPNMTVHVQPTKPRLPKERRVRTSVTAEQKSIEKKLKALLGDKGCSDVDVFCVDNCLYTIVNSPNSKCLISDDCSSNPTGKYLTVWDDGRVYYHCLYNTSHTSAFGLYLGDLSLDNTISWVGNEFTGRVSGFSDWDAELFVKRSEHSDEYVKSFTLDFGRQCLLVVAGMGKGKTTQAINLMSSGKFKRILYVVPRRTLGWDIMRAIHESDINEAFQHYSDGVDGDRIVIVYQSLHRLVGKESFDLVICDEIRSIGQSMTNLSTNRSNLNTNACVLKTMSRQATMWVGMDQDAEADGVVPHLLQSWWSNPGRIQIERYTTPKIKRRMHLCSDETAWLKRITDRLGEGASVAICCRTKSRAVALHRLLEKPEYNAMLVTADSDDKEVIETLKDINSALETSRLFVYTSKINIGVDIQLSWGYCFIDGKGGLGCSARDLIQMCGRFRNLENIDVYLVVARTEPKFEHEADLMARVSDYYQRRKEIIDGKYRQILSFDGVFQDGFLTLAPDWSTRMFILTSVERHIDFTYELYRLCVLNQYRVYRIPAVPNNDDAVAANKSAVKGDKADQLREIFEVVKQCDPSAVLVEAHERCRRDEGNQANNLRIQCANALRFFKKPEEARFEDFVLVDANLPRLRMLAIAQSMRTELLIRMEIRSLHRHKWANHTIYSKLLQYKYVDDALHILGVNGIDDYETRFTTTTLQTSEADLRRALVSSAAATRRATSSRKQPKIITLLRNELRETFGIKLTQKRVHGKLFKYSISKPAELLDVLARVDFGYNFDEQLCETEDIERHYT